jgi:hypothetical protein
MGLIVAGVRDAERRATVEASGDDGYATPALRFVLKRLSGQEQKSPVLQQRWAVYGNTERNPGPCVAFEWRDVPLAEED